MELNTLTSEIINAAIEVLKELGPGLLESVYQACMIVGLFHRNLKVESEVAVPVLYRGIKVNEDGSDLTFWWKIRLLLNLNQLRKYCQFIKSSC